MEAASVLAAITAAGLKDRRPAGRFLDKIAGINREIVIAARS